MKDFSFKNSSNVSDNIMNKLFCIWSNPKTSEALKHTCDVLFFSLIEGSKFLAICKYDKEGAMKKHWLVCDTKDNILYARDENMVGTAFVFDGESDNKLLLHPVQPTTEETKCTFAFGLAIPRKK